METDLLNHYNQRLRDNNLPEMTEDERNGWILLFKTQYKDMIEKGTAHAKLAMENSDLTGSEKSILNVVKKGSNFAKNKLSKEVDFNSFKLLRDVPDYMLYWKQAGNAAYVASAVSTKVLFGGDESYAPAGIFADMAYVPDTFWEKWAKTNAFSKFARKVKKQGQHLGKVTGVSKGFRKAMPFKGGGK